MDIELTDTQTQLMRDNLNDLIIYLNNNKYQQARKLFIDLISEYSLKQEYNSKFDAITWKNSNDEIIIAKNIKTNQFWFTYLLLVLKFESIFGDNHYEIILFLTYLMELMEATLFLD